MKITIVCDVLGEENNGTSIAAMNLIRYLRKQNHEVTLLCGDEDKKNDPHTFVVPNLNLGSFINNYIKKVGVTLAKVDKKIVAEACKDADIVHILLPFPLGICALNYCLEHHIPTTSSFHMQAENFTYHIGLDKVNWVNKQVYKTIYNLCYKKVNAIHFPTEFIKTTFEHNINKKIDYGYVISNGVHSYVQKKDVEKPLEYKDKILVLSTGRFAPEKSQDTLIKAIKLSKYEKDIQLVLGGKGPKEKKYKKLGEQLTNKPVMKLFDRHEIIDALNSCDFYVHPAVVELEGISCIEGVVCGKCVIVSDSPKSATKGFAVDEKCIFNKRNPQDLANKIDYLIEHPLEKKEIEDKYLNSAKAFALEDCMKQMEFMMYDTYKKYYGREYESKKGK